MRSFPRPEFALSAPRPRKSSSRPGPPHTKSLPWRALTRSCPRPATMTSRAAVPTSWSPPFVPTIVALCPKHVGETAADAVPVTARAAIAKTAARTTRFVVGFTSFLFGRRGLRLDDARKISAAANTALMLFSLVDERRRTLLRDVPGAERLGSVHLLSSPRRCERRPARSPPISPTRQRSRKRPCPFSCARTIRPGSRPGSAWAQIHPRSTALRQHREMRRGEEQAFATSRRRSAPIQSTRPWRRPSCMVSAGAARAQSCP